MSIELLSVGNSTHGCDRSGCIACGSAEGFASACLISLVVGFMTGKAGSLISFWYYVCGVVLTCAGVWGDFR